MGGAEAEGTVQVPEVGAIYGWDLRSVCRLRSTGQMLPHRGSSNPFFVCCVTFWMVFSKTGSLGLSSPCLGDSLPWRLQKEHHSVERKARLCWRPVDRQRSLSCLEYPLLLEPPCGRSLCAPVYLGAMESPNLKGQSLWFTHCHHVTQSSLNPSLLWASFWGTSFPQHSALF